MSFGETIRPGPGGGEDTEQLPVHYWDSLPARQQHDLRCRLWPRYIERQQHSGLTYPDRSRVGVTAEVLLSTRREVAGITSRSKLSPGASAVLSPTLRGFTVGSQQSWTGSTVWQLPGGEITVLPLDHHRLGLGIIYLGIMCILYRFKIKGQYM